MADPYTDDPTTAIDQAEGRRLKALQMSIDVGVQTTEEVLKRAKQFVKYLQGDSTPGPTPP